MSGNASPLEVTWTLIGVAGLLFTAWLTAAAFLDRRAVQESIDADPPRARAWGPRWWVALRDTGMWLGLGYLWLIFIGVGLLAMRYPPPPPNPDQHISSQLLGWLLISAELALALVQGWYVYCRTQINNAEQWVDV